MEYDEINQIITLLTDLENSIDGTFNGEMLDAIFGILEIERMKALINNNIEIRNRICEQED